MRKRRAQSQSDRDITGLAARRERDAAPLPFECEEATGRYEGAELARIRASREPGERFAKIETRVDKLERDVAVGFASSHTKLDTMLGYAAAADAERERRHKADALALERRRKHVIALIGALGAAVALVIAALVKLS